MGCCSNKDPSATVSLQQRQLGDKQHLRDEELARQLRAEQFQHDADFAQQLQAAEEDLVAGRDDRPNAGDSQTLAIADWEAVGTGRVLGGSSAATEQAAGLSAEERRRKALDAAEKRHISVPGISEQRVIQMRETQQKGELLGRLTEHYDKKKLEMPIGLRAASLEQLKKYWEHAREDSLVQGRSREAALEETTLLDIPVQDSLPPLPPPASPPPAAGEIPSVTLLDTRDHGGAPKEHDESIAQDTDAAVASAAEADAARRSPKSCWQGLGGQVVRLIC